jgi:hypothetical protein
LQQQLLLLLLLLLLPATRRAQPLPTHQPQQWTREQQQA